MLLAFVGPTGVRKHWPAAPLPHGIALPAATPCTPRMSRRRFVPQMR